jgi:hypothetical protein
MGNLCCPSKNKKRESELTGIPLLAAENNFPAIIGGAKEYIPPKRIGLSENKEEIELSEEEKLRLCM